MRHHHYERIGTLDAEKVLSLIPIESRKQKIRKFFGRRISFATKRLRVFAVKGVRCKCCGIQGSFFAIERHKECDPTRDPDKKEVKFRPNLYAVSTCGEEIMITIDHIMPKSVGGKNNIENLQPMCEPCNLQKGCEIPPHLQEIENEPARHDKNNKRDASNKER